ncbi:MAG: ATP-binding cassette domain-containing protein, partial [Actinobacteria bacterium]|nr:ATP-binding cassette domain-containing protein [Actinomycetota bacterium]
MTALLELDGVCAGYGRSIVVRDLDLTVEAGEVVALLGPNGAGKTTTLRTAAGLQPALGGSVRLLGHAVDVRRPHRNARRGLAFVTEHRSLFPQLTVRENLRLAERSAGAWAELAGLFPMLDPLLGRKAGLLSGGEQQLLAIARALTGRPRLVLVDEMSLGLAPVIVADLAPLLRRAADERDV